MSVADRFKTLLSNITLSQVQLDDGSTKRGSVCAPLNAKYYSSSSSTDNSQYVGSWGKYTRIRPPRDVDVLFRLPYSVFERYELKIGNKQSQLLQEIKLELQKSFPRTEIRGDGPVVAVPFQTYSVELLPGFKLQNGQYWIPITTGGGTYKNFDPEAESSHIQASNSKWNNNTRDLIRMLKCWQSYCSVPLKSFYLELLAVNFLDQWQHAGQSATFYDWMIRDFFLWLSKQGTTTLYVPGTYEPIRLTSDWVSKAQSAFERSAKAAHYESEDSHILAGIEWQKIFGKDIPLA
ncbi:SMODS domain-containing nucleotidyltransferase [Aestuariivirga sp.]|uniref:SMODS domain-containing nucleotidyltransferase n=1 Tax=Aestuariivirga sp. TaxID=2650926 RepID=UPI0039197E42